jgi:flavin-dependent dehydrogenase
MELIGRQRQDLPVVIIGAGPAGCAASIVLGRNGIPCLMLERFSGSGTGAMDEPRESLHGGVELLLQQLGAEDAWSLAATGTFHEVHQLGAATPVPSMRTSRLHGVHVRRSRFDHYLRMRVVASGTSIRYGSRVQDLLWQGDRVVGVRLVSGELRHARYVIDASGRAHLGARRIGAQRQFATEPLVARTGRLACVKAPRNSASFTPEAEGWCWLAVDGDGSATWTRVTSHARDILPKESRLIRPDTTRRAFGVRWTLNRPLVCSGLLLAGDAASMLDPAAGQGVFKALNDGILAASAVLRILQMEASENLNLALYDQRIVTTFEEQTATLAAAYQEHRIPFRIDLL